MRWVWLLAVVRAQGADPGDVRTADFRREISDSCLFCHNGYPSEANAGLALGIDCQRCHGPGEAHLQGKARMVNPSRLSSERQIEICMQCHLESASRTLPDAIRRFG